MKPWVKVSVILLIAVLVILFFSVSKTYSISGDDAVLTTHKEKVRDCTLSIEIQEITALAMDYRRTFSFALNDAPVPLSEQPHSYGIPSQGLWAIDYFYYDGAINGFNSCSLLYQKDLSHGDLSYAVVHWNDKLYFINNGSDMTYAEIPLQIGTE